MDHQTNKFASESEIISFSSPIFSSTSDEKWWSKDTVAIVTGANKGIGFAFVKRLMEMGLTVILTARDPGRGKKAYDELLLGMKNEEDEHNLHFFCLDVSQQSSIETFVSWFKTKFGALDILVNNAGVSFNDINENSVEHAEIVMQTNFLGPKLLTQSLLPMFRYSASISRILNISSRLGSINKMKNPKIKQILQNENLMIEHIEDITNLFLKDVKNDTWKKRGWPSIWTQYSVSKLMLNAYSKILAKQYENKKLSVNCFCPGFTQTSMTGGKGTHTTSDAAELGVKLVLLNPKELKTGKFYIGFGSYKNINSML